MVGGNGVPGAAPAGQQGAPGVRDGAADRGREELHRVEDVRRESLPRPGIVEIGHHMHVPAQRREERPGRNIPIAIQPGPPLPPRQPFQDPRVFRIVPPVVCHPCRDESRLGLRSPLPRLDKQLPVPRRTDASATLVIFVSSSIIASVWCRLATGHRPMALPLTTRRRLPEGRSECRWYGRACKSGRRSPCGVGSLAMGYYMGARLSSRVPARRTACSCARNRRRSASLHNRGTRMRSPKVISQVEKGSGI